MRKLVLLFFVLTATIAFSQKDSLIIGDKYLEDQLYLSISYNVLANQPSEVSDTGFSYGISAGFIKDLPVNSSRTISLGLGVGYGFDSFNHKLKVVENNNQFTFEVDNALTSNKLRLHTIEFPLEIRWRNSTKNRYAFWRIYTGLKLTYNFSNKFLYKTDLQSFSFTNISPYNNWQTGLTISAGYDAFNLYFYYGLTPIYNQALLEGNTINSKIMKFGITFYIL